MARVLNFFRTIRNNWKKSAVGAAALSYGVNYGVECYDTEQLMRQYCEDAVRYGDMPLPTNVKPRHITIILNPAAHKRKAKNLLEKYCEPLLHLAGIAVTIIQTDSEGQARSLVEKLSTHTDAIVVAGGDGTLSDVVTGVMRRNHADLAAVRNCPIGVLPLGMTNRVANSLFYGYEDQQEIKAMAEATMAIVRGTTKLADIVEIELMEQDAENPIKPVYALGAVEWGAWRDAHARLNKYWYWGRLRSYATYIFNGYKRDLTWDCNATLRYSDPCSGCSRCYNSLQISSKSASSDRRWWHAFIPRIRSTPSVPEVDYSHITNEDCGTFHEMSISTTELVLTTRNVETVPSDGPSSIKLQLGPKTVGYKDFVAEGWKRENGNKSMVDQTLEAKEIELIPQRAADNSQEKEQMFSIDNEEFEVKPIKIRLLPKSVTMFCPQSVS